MTKTVKPKRKYERKRHACQCCGDLAGPIRAYHATGFSLALVGHFCESCGSKLLTVAGDVALREKKRLGSL